MPRGQLQGRERGLSAFVRRAFRVRPLRKLDLRAGTNILETAKPVVAEHDIAPPVGSPQIIWFVVSVVLREGRDMIQRWVSVVRRPRLRISREPAYLADISVTVKNKLPVLTVARRCALSCRRRYGSCFCYALPSLTFLTQAIIIPAFRV